MGTYEPKIQIIYNMQKSLSEGCSVSEAIEGMRADLTARPIVARAPMTTGYLLGQLYDIEEDYRRACSFMSQGYDDDSRDALCAKLIDRCYQLAGNIHLCRLAEINASIIKAAATARVAAETPDALQEKLERFTEDVAMIELEDESRRAEKSHLIYSAHARMADNLFCQMVASTAWDASTASRYGDIILSPTVSSLDSQLMVSALTLSLLTVFDTQKWLLLVRVWREAVSDALSQRAFVGLVLTIPKQLSGTSDAPLAAVRQTITAILDSDDSRRQLLELQMQIFQCLNADADGQRLQEEIMPTLMKNSSIVVKNGEIVERDDDPMDDILPHGSVEDAEKKVEESFRQIADMQEQGADIYFHGLRQMKRFAFFSTLSNWFLPFYPEHPDLESLSPTTKGMVRLMTSQQQFCESDKYSIALAFRHVGVKMPPSLGEHFANSSSLVSASIPTSPTIERRRYLQDLFRFFAVCPSSSDFENPFNDKSRLFFFAAGVLPPEMLAAEAEQLASFFYKHKLWTQIVELYRALDSYATPTVCQLAAGASQRLGDSETAYRLSKQQMEAAPIPFVVGVNAAAARSLGKWKEASKSYALLLDCYPGDKQWVEMALAISLLHQGRTREALPHLQHCYYLQPGNVKVVAAIMAAYLADGSADEALKVGEATVWPDDSEQLDDEKKAAFRRVGLRHYYALLLSRRIGDANLLLARAFSQLFASSLKLLREAIKADRELQNHLSISRHTIDLSASVVLGEGLKGS